MGPRKIIDSDTNVNLLKNNKALIHIYKSIRSIVTHSLKQEWKGRKMHLIAGQN